MTVKVIVGTQWGDEGKGKITDILAETSNYIVRYQGGNNAGHTVVVGNSTYKLHLIPSGILYDNCVCIIGNGVVFNPLVFFQEIDNLQQAGVKVSSANLKVSLLAHVILPFHMMLDAKQETSRAVTEKIGTTGRGIGPCYTDKISRAGIRVQDLLNKSRLAKRIKMHNWAEVLDNPELNIDEIIEEYYQLGQKLRPYLIDGSLVVNQAIDSNKNIVLEGAQGAMLDVDHGTYPFVTSSNPISGGACAGAGIGPNKIQGVIGVTKAYVTRVGAGPFPTELEDAVGDALRDKGHEFGTTTGRPRRCGWLDLVALKYAIRINGLTELCLTKLDVLDGQKTIKVCTKYQTTDGILEHFPLDQDILEECRPVYEELPGWTEDISQVTQYEDLPVNAQKYIQYLEKITGLKVSMVSVGPARENTIYTMTPITA